MSFGKIFESAYTGSLFGRGVMVFAVWPYVIAHAKPPGIVELNPRLMASVFGSTVAEVEDAIKVLCEPDKLSRNTDAEGRRLVHIGGMDYRVVSFKKYRMKLDEEARREYQREWDRENRPVRDRRQSDSPTVRQQPDTTRHNPTNPTQAEAEAEAEAEKEKGQKKKHPAHAKRERQSDFETLWQVFPRKVSKGRAEKTYVRMNPDAALLNRMIEAIRAASQSEQWRKDGGKYIPHLSTWLNDRGWEDDLTTPPRTNGTYVQPEWMRNAI